MSSSSSNIHPHTTSPYRPPTEDVPITARWCNRALRPLIASLSRVERELKDTTVPPHNQNEHLERPPSSRLLVRSRGKRGPGRPRTYRPEDGSSDVEGSAKDPTWVPDRNAQKRVRHHYQSRKRRRWTVVPSEPEVRRLHPGEFDITLSPVSAESSQEQRQAAALRDVSVDCEHNVAKTSRKKTYDIATAARSATGRTALQSLRTSWLRFLYITAPCSEPKYTGAKSLLSMAMRSTSSWISNEQKLADEYDDDVDVADGIFSYLEEIYSQGSGWKPLKGLARRHGIRLLCEAIHQHWLSASTTEYFGTITRGERHWDAAEAIYAAYRSSVAPWLEKPKIPLHVPGACYEMHRPYDMILSYRKFFQGGSFTWREMAKSIDAGQIPVEWVPALSLQEVVTDALWSIVKEDSHSSAAAEFIASIIRSAIGLRHCSTSIPRDQQTSRKLSQHQSALSQKPIGKQTRRSASNRSISDENAEALNNSVASFLKILGAAHTQRTNGVGQKYTLMQGIISDLLNRCYRTSYSYDHLQQPEQLRVAYIFVAFFIYIANGSNRSTCLEPFENFTKSLKDRSFLVKGLANFAIGLCCGRKSDVESGYPYLQEVVGFFLAIDGTFYPTVRALLGKVAVDAALDFAALTLLPEHHDFAVSVQNKVEARRLICTVELTPSLAMRGYKWDDGFGEWVVRTPAPTRCSGKSRRAAMYISDSPSDDLEETNSCCKLGSDSPIVYDSQDDEGTAMSSQSSTVFSPLPVACGSNATTPSPVRKRSVSFSSDDDDSVRAAPKRSRLRPRHSTLRSEPEQGCVLSSQGTIDDEIEDGEEDDDSPDESDECTNRRGPYSLRHQQSCPIRPGSHLQRPLVSDGGRQLRPRQNRPSYSMQIYEDESQSGTGSSSSASSSGSQKDAKPSKPSNRYALRERRSFNNSAVSVDKVILASHQQRSLKPCNFAIVINNSSNRVPRQLESPPRQVAVHTPPKRSSPLVQVEVQVLKNPQKTPMREITPIVLETGYEDASEDELIAFPQPSQPTYLRQGRRLRRDACTASQREDVKPSMCLRSRLTSVLHHTPEGGDSSEDELSLLV